MPPEPLRLRFCIHNVHSQRERDALEAQGIEPQDCFSRCSACFDCPYLVRGDADPQDITEDDVIEAEDNETHADLIRRARQ